MNNVQFNVRGVGKEILLDTMRLVFKVTAHKNATHWAIIPKKGLVLFWFKPENIAKEQINVFLSPSNPELVTDMIWSWLEQNRDKVKEFSDDTWYFGQADSDVLIKPAFRVYCEDWGHVAGSPCAICGIRPAFAWYGK